MEIQSIRLGSRAVLFFLRTHFGVPGFMPAACLFSVISLVPKATAERHSDSRIDI